MTQKQQLQKLAGLRHFCQRCVNQFEALGDLVTAGGFLHIVLTLEETIPGIKTAARFREASQLSLINRNTQKKSKVRRISQ